jgi:glycolate oxidase FAD binding subunit
MPLVATNPGQDLTDRLVEQVRAASQRRTPLRIAGGDSKRFYGRPVDAERLDVAGHRGIVRYDPAELVLTARCGTPLAEVEALLARHGQRLPFEPPAFGATATIGGTIAAGIAGPARVAHGPVRDYVLGTRLLAGDGRVLRFGGEVMKNVAGFDVARLLAGSLGILGVLLDVSLKVMPLPAGTLTLRQQIAAPPAVELLASLARRGVPVSGSLWCDGELLVRLEGAAAGFDELAALVGGTPVPEAEAATIWRALREQSHPWFERAPRPLWRIALPLTAAALTPLCDEPLVLEWNGRQAWVSGVGHGRIERLTHANGAHATLFRRNDADAAAAASEVFAPLPAALLQLHRAVKRVFDPASILNSGRMYAGL